LWAGLKPGPSTWNRSSRELRMSLARADAQRAGLKPRPNVN
jgi:hypothetical protein